MSQEPTLLFLHGVGDGNRDRAWLTGLEAALSRLGYPRINPERILAPRYAHALRDCDESFPLPKINVKQPARDKVRQNRRDFERRTAALEFRLGRHDHGTGWGGAELVVNGAANLPGFAQVRKYLGDADVRAQVLRLILRKLPAAGRIVIVGHSLGSVIAADLIQRLPKELEVVGLVTIGSPLASGRFNVDKLRENMQEPPTNLAWWANFWNVLDPVAAHRGLSSVFNWMLDFRIGTGFNHHVHDAETYLSHDAVAEAVGFGLFGSKSKEIVLAERGLDIPLDASELTALVALRYAHLLKERLDGEQGIRFAGALRQVQATVVDEIRQRNKEAGRPLPSQVARLAFDASDSNANVPEPLPSRHLTKEDAVTLLTVLASENVIRPFDINVDRGKWLGAMRELTSEMGLGSQYGTHVFEAAKEAQDVLSGALVIDWKKWGALGAGAVALVVATGGLALAAAPGVVGAAVITSALAGFGPGGMIGGLLTAGTLVGAGGGGIAFSLASPGTSAETVEAVIQRRLAAAILRQRQNLEPDYTLWSILTSNEITVRREYERLDEFSDESAQTLKELKKKLETIGRAMKYLCENGLEPKLVEDLAEDAEDLAESQDPAARQPSPLS
ncbi:pimeloyl-ACP methyl ester carboxylesterase [Arthrobacter globiformis]|nr:pimeloyl-ACP methyl ester carboxylesterase [Arthrobacter globiformis]